MRKFSCLVVLVLAIGIARFETAVAAQNKDTAETSQHIEQVRQQLLEEMTKEYQKFKQEVIASAKKDLLEFTRKLPAEVKQDMQTMKQQIEQKKL